jgi:hypothetical protein
VSALTPFEQLQKDLAEHVTGGAYFADIPVLTEEIGDLDSAIDAALAGGGVKANDSGKAGLAISIITPDGKGTDEAGDDVVVLGLTMRVTVAVNPIVNKSANGVGKNPLEVLWKLISRIHGWRRHEDAEPVRFLSFDSLQSDDGLNYFADFRFPIALQLDAEPEPENP